MLGFFFCSYSNRTNAFYQPGVSLAVFSFITLPGKFESRAEGLVPYCCTCVNSFK